MLNYEAIKNRPRFFRPFTGFDKIEFEIMLKPFNDAWNIYVQKTHIDGKNRTRSYGGGRKPILCKIEDKLLFILFYYKNYPIQEVIAFLFGMSQGQAYQWIHKLSEVLQMALGKEKLLPERKPSCMKDILASCEDLSFIIDGVERRIQRPKDQTKQNKYYSGKKKPIR